MALIPKTAKELREYLETVDDDTRIFIEGSDDNLWTFSIEKGKVSLDSPFGEEEATILFFSMFKSLWG